MVAGSYEETAKLLGGLPRDLDHLIEEAERLGARIFTAVQLRVRSRIAPLSPRQQTKGSLVRRFRNRGGRTRTCNPRFWRPVLCQLSYAPRLPTDCIGGPLAS
jgi:hypothetical protein